jgi:hypothetical protein
MWAAPVSAAPTPTPVPAPLVVDWGADGAHGEIWAVVGNGSEQTLAGAQWRLWLERVVAGHTVNAVAASGEIPALGPGSTAVIAAAGIAAPGTYRFQALMSAGRDSRDAWSGAIVYPPVGPTAVKPAAKVTTATAAAKTPAATTAAAKMPATNTPAVPTPIDTVPPTAAPAAATEATVSHAVLLPLGAPAADTPAPSATPEHIVLVPAVAAAPNAAQAPAATEAPTASATPGEATHVVLVPNIGAGPAAAAPATPEVRGQTGTPRASFSLGMLLIYAGFALVALAVLGAGFALVRTIVRKG